MCSLRDRRNNTIHEIIIETMNQEYLVKKKKKNQLRVLREKKYNYWNKEKDWSLETGQTENRRWNWVILPKYDTKR